MAQLFFSDEQSFKEIEVDLWHEMAKSLAKSSHPFRYPSLATQSEEGPQQRTVVLRSVKSTAKELWFYTDGRSAKVQELAQDERAAVHAFHPRKKLQLRFKGSVKVLKSGEKWQEAFDGIPKNRYFEYSTQKAPGTGLDEVPEAYPSQPEQAAQYFRLLIFKTDQLEALQLNANRHFRVLFSYSQKELRQAQWLQP